jgi:signal transduction histidine kinase
MGVSLTYFVTYRKARSALLETARQNVTESAVRKAKDIEDLIILLQITLINASRNTVLELNNSLKQQEFLEGQRQLVPEYLDCVELTDVNSKKLLYSTCNNNIFTQLNLNFWAQKKPTIFDNSHIYIKYIFPEQVNEVFPNQNLIQGSKQLQLLLAAPIYNPQGKLSAILSFKVSLLTLELLKTGSLAGYPMIINEQGTFLVHPFPEKIGGNISNEDDYQRLNLLLKNAISGRQDFLHLFSIQKNSRELLAGYTAIPSPISGEENKKWIILAVTSLDNALIQLKDIQNTLFVLLTILVIGLIVASLVAILYLSRELSQPLEKLTEFTLENQNIQKYKKNNYSFKIKEIDELYQSLTQMMEGLQAGAKEIERAWQDAKIANQLKNEFLATTSHELRTPLNGIIGSLRLIKDGCCDNKEEELEFIEQADQAAVHLLAIINDVLDISKIEAGQIYLNLKPIDFNKLLEEVISLQSGLIKSKKLTLTIEKRIPNIKIYADYYKFKQVLINIIGNAIKFTDFGTITLETYLTQTEDNLTNFLTIKVIDTGIGIPLNQQKKLFKPFVMVDGSTTRKFSGTGLGLAISKNLIEMMEGSITLFSLGENHGTTVTLTIPIAK